MKIGILTIVLIIPINNFDKKYVCVIFNQRSMGFLSLNGQSKIKILNEI